MDSEEKDMEGSDEETASPRSFSRKERSKKRRERQGDASKSPSHPQVETMVREHSEERGDMTQRIEGSIKKMSEHGSTMAPSQTGKSIISSDLMKAQRNLSDKVFKLEGVCERLERQISHLHEHVNKTAENLQGMIDTDPAEKMDRLQRRMITTVCGEMIDPFKRNMNIDLKTLRKHLEECMVTLDEHRGRHLTYQ